MFRPRLIPVLLLKNNALVKSIKFKDYKYIGDPINAVKIFNELKADELVLLDIDATSKGKRISSDVIKRVGEEANMPFSVGGGISDMKDIQELIACGAEKVILNSHAVKNPLLIKQASEYFGSSTIVLCIDVKKKFLSKSNYVFINNGKVATRYEPIKWAQLAEEMGAGEIIIQSISKDGTMEGYDLELLKSISDAVTIPTVALGGAGNFSDFQSAYRLGRVNGIAAGSFFVYQGRNKGVLINYPSSEDIIRINQLT
ncbi:AglZ/HisF2 family acetamidino modification protein [Pseudomonadota bacterium]|jgi:cyclase|nr:AglZ/HisF2 family acetamidino modification protein [Pseudomonadota bacterium]